MSDDLTKLRLADGCITKMCVNDGALRVFVRNWRDETQILTFDDVIGVEAFSILNADLSHAQQSQDDPFLEKSCLIGAEKTSEFHCYAFFAAWSEIPILKIVARKFSISESTGADSGGNAGDSIC